MSEASEASETNLRPLVTLLLAGTLGRLPFVTLPVASLLLVADRTSLTRAGLASGALSLGAGLIGLLLGRLLDGPHVKRVLGALALANVPAVAIFVGTASSKSNVLLAATGFLAGSTIPPVAPVVRALLAERTNEADAQRVFAWDAISAEITWIGGPLLVSLATWLAGPVAAVAMSPALGAIGVVAIFGQRSSHRAKAGDAGPWLTRPVVQLLLSFAVVGTAFRAETIQIAAVAKRAGQEGASGVLIAVWAVGSLIGGIVAARRGLAKVPVLGLILAVTVAAVGLGSRSIVLTGLLAFVSGIPVAPYVAGLNALVSRHAPSHAHARAFSAMQAGSTVLASGGAWLGGAAVDRFGPASLAIPAGLLVLVSAGLSNVQANV